MTNEEPLFNTLPAVSKKAWRINNSMWAGGAWLVTIALILNSYLGNFVPLWLIWTAAGAAVLFSILLVGIIPAARWRRWRYRINKHEIDLQRGIVIVRRTLIPIHRVQHVDTRQGPVMRKYALAEVVISTAATTHKIPALKEATAEQVRTEISTFARKAKEDV